jgi:hypothetical protein
MIFKSAGQAIHDAYAIHLRTPEFGATRSGGATNYSSQVANCVEAGKVIAVVEALPTDTRHWLMFCYGPACSHYMKSAWHVAGVLWEQMQQHGISDKKRLAISGLCMIVAQDFQAKLLRGEVTHAPGKVAKLLGVSPDHYRRDYGPWINRMERVLDAWDAEGLCAVGAVVYREQDKERAYRQYG